MPSFEAYFTANGGPKCEVVSCSYHFEQSIDDKGRPSSRVQGGTLDVTIISNDTVGPYIDWMLDQYKRASGSITFNRADQDSKLKEISFDDAYCVGFTENFDSRGAGSDASMTLSLRISAGKLTVEGKTLDNKWV